MPRKLVVEVDGGYHQIPEQIISDEERTKRLNQLGYKVIRFSNEEVLNDIENVLKTIKHILYELVG
jgi:guanylate kinase